MKTIHNPELVEFIKFAKKNPARSAFSRPEFEGRIISDGARLYYTNDCKQAVTCEHPIEAGAYDIRAVDSKRGELILEECATSCNAHLLTSLFSKSRPAEKLSISINAIENLYFNLIDFKLKRCPALKIVNFLENFCEKRREKSLVAYYDESAFNFHIGGLWIKSCEIRHDYLVDAIKIPA